MYKTVQINYYRKVFGVIAYPCVLTSVIRVSIRVRGLHLVSLVTVQGLMRKL